MKQGRGFRCTSHRVARDTEGALSHVTRRAPAVRVTDSDTKGYTLNLNYVFILLRNTMQCLHDYLPDLIIQPFNVNFNPIYLVLLNLIHLKKAANV
jgi:hypothetical protein